MLVHWRRQLGLPLRNPPSPLVTPPPQTLVALLQDQGSKRDVYGRIGYANTYLYTAPKDRRDDSVKKAEARFSKVREGRGGTAEGGGGQGEGRGSRPGNDGALSDMRGCCARND